MVEKDSSMSPKVLRRCSICKKFHAAYLVEDPQLGKVYLCYSCWTARWANPPLLETDQKTDKQVPSPETKT
jgi:hypothetical protein